MAPAEGDARPRRRSPARPRAAKATPKAIPPAAAPPPAAPPPGDAPPPAPAWTPAPPAPPNPHEAPTFAMLCHLGAFAAVIGVPVGHILGPLVFWLIKKNQHPLVDAHGRASLNFQISWTIYAAILTLAIVVLQVLAFGLGAARFGQGPSPGFFPVPFFGGFLGTGVLFLLFLALIVAWFVQVIVASVNANKGAPARYWLAIPFLGRAPWDAPAPAAPRQ